MKTTLCKLDGCDLPHYSKGFCRKHYKQNYRTENPISKMGRSHLIKHPLERAIKYIEKDYNEVGCWKWTGSPRISGVGYGVISETIDGKEKQHSAHRYIYEQLVGPVPDNLVLDHFMYPQDNCLGPYCVNPEHLLPVTSQKNVSRSPFWNGNKTHCSNGHEFTQGNIQRTAKNPTHRICRICAKIRRDKFKAK